MNQRIIILDKDDTIYRRACFPGVENFLEVQKAARRNTVLATRALSEEVVNAQLGNEIRSLINEVYAGSLNSLSTIYYYDDNGNLTDRENDYYQHRIPAKEERILRNFLKESGIDIYDSAMYAADFHVENQKVMAAVRRFKEIGQWRSKANDSPFDDTKKYKNPYIDRGGTGKDLYLLRQLLVKKGYSPTYEAVMIGNNSDIVAPISEPSTPLIRVAGPDWLTRQRIYAILDTLLPEQGQAATHFDDLFSAGVNSNAQNLFPDGHSTEDLQSEGKPVCKEVIIKGETFVLGRYTMSNARVICENPL